MPQDVKSFFLEKDIKNQFLFIDTLHDVSVSIKREDLLHEYVSGNKFRKLKYNILRAKELGRSTIVTFGGAYSNHIAATAAACNILGLHCVGIIRGEELAHVQELNPTLTQAKKNGMELIFVSRKQYREKHSQEFSEWIDLRFANSYIVPEGGTNELAVLGTQEILQTSDSDFDYICCAVGTGGTIAGIINASSHTTQIVGFPALKGDFLYGEIKKFASKENFELVSQYHFGGYAKFDDELLQFINDFEQKYGILLDPIYTSKMMFGIIDLINKGWFKKGSKILAIHTGGLQGWSNSYKEKK